MYICQISGERLQDHWSSGILTITSEYGSSVFDPHYGGLIDDLEKVQKPAASFVTRNYTYEIGSMKDILKKLKWRVPAEKEG